MNNKIPLALTLCSTMIALPLQANDGHQWRAIAFGQSTDSNFSSNVLPEKIGVNDVTIAGKKLTPQDVADLSQPITIESRGGKIANSHDGLTFFYTRLPTSQNFILQATVTVNQFGPENGARPAAQEGAGPRCNRSSASTAAEGRLRRVSGGIQYGDERHYDAG